MSTYHLLEARPYPAKLSLVIPIYNEFEVLPLLRDALSKVTFDCPLELILVNDGSADRSLDVLMAWASADSNVKVIALSRNFGHQAAVTAGLDAATGDAIVVMDADLQDPPQVVQEMLIKYQQGYDVVYGQRLDRSGESVFKKWTAWAFYRLMKKLIHKDLPLDTGDFRCLSRSFLDQLKTLRETHRFLRGMGTWVGFSQTPVRYNRSPRAAGVTKYPLSKMIKFAWTAAVSFSPLPLQFSFTIGVCVAVSGFFVGVYAIGKAIIHYLYAPVGQMYSPGWATIVTLVCLIGGMNLIAIGILGEFVGRIFEESKRRPLYIIKTKKNLDNDQEMI